MPALSGSSLTPDRQLQLPVEARQRGEQQAPDLKRDSKLRDWIAQLWVQHQGLLLQFAHFQLRDWDRAQEVVQDTWVDFLKGLHRFEGRCSAKTWLVQILARRLKKERRRTILRRAREALLGIGAAGSYTQDVAERSCAPDWGRNPDQALLLQECVEHILRFGRTLPRQQAEVWLLRDVYQWTSEEVSNTLVITRENQRTLLHRARQRLRLEIERRFGLTSAAQSPRAHSHDLQRT